MDANSSTINRFKAQVNKFSGIISKELNKVQSRLVKELVYGIQASKDIKISSVSRSLQESIPLAKTEDRICRNLAAKDISSDINAQILRLGSSKVTKDMVITIDPGDITKPYAKAMENLCNVYDGSKGATAIGYHLCQVTAANLEHNTIVPLYCEVFSDKEADYKTATKKVISIIEHLHQSIGSNGVWAIDRMGDCNEIVDCFLDNGLDFVTRLKLNRWLIVHNKNGGEVPVKTANLEKHMKLNFRAQITKIDNGKEKLLNLKFGIKKVQLQNDPKQWLNVLFIKGYGAKPMILLTNLEPDKDNTAQVFRILEIYLTRWKCEECYRYLKQSYKLEDIRVRSYNGIRNMAAIVHAIAYFISIYIGISLKLKVLVQKIFILSKRFFGVSSFFHYAMADGIFELLSKTHTGIQQSEAKEKPNAQLTLFEDFF